ncbi:MAG: Hpt domain-containing protein, partial [Elusimicrobiales bacterium]|nr:Hpt domain-containing protein [Elusimicrobiales bacterium]
REEAAGLKALLSAGSFEEIKRIGHKLAGSGGGYGLDRLSDIGRDIESHAAFSEARALESDIAALTDFLERLEVSYE